MHSIHSSLIEDTTMIRIRALPGLLSLLLLSACVTINVYFPAAAAEKAADRILEEVYGKQPDAAPGTAPKQDEHGALSPQLNVAAVFNQLLEWVIAPAHAEADLSVDTPAVRALTASLNARQSKLAPHYDSGAIGMTAGGNVEIRDQNAVPLKDRNALKALVADDNKDWDALYREVANANGHPEWEGDIRDTFAQRWWATTARSGWYFKDGGAWKRK
jgi:uncharacterized protein YdbL (DUF1318 family)